MPPTQVLSTPWGDNDVHAPTSIVEPIADLLRMRSKGWGSEMNTEAGDFLNLHLMRALNAIVACEIAVSWAAQAGQCGQV